MNILENIIEIHKNIICKIPESEPVFARESFLKTNFCVVSLLNAIKLNNTFVYDKIDSALQCYHFLHDINQISDEEKNIIISHYYRYKKEFDRILFLELCEDPIDLLDLYEFILSLDLTVVNGQYDIIYGDKYRDRSGAYYTSLDLAFASVKKAIDNFFAKKFNCNDEIAILIRNNQNAARELIHTMRMVDMSCGTGNFLIAAIKYIQELDVDIDINVLLKNIYAFDVDLIALRIALTEVTCLGSNIYCMKEINKNFVFGNTLLENYDENIENRLDAFLKGFLYSNSLGINHGEYINKFDIIVGNPPWEKIRLEDKNFFSNYAPSIASISKKNLRQNSINQLSYTNPQLMSYYLKSLCTIDTAKKQINSNYLYKYSSHGELNTYSLFTELGEHFLKDGGELCLIVKSSLITSKANQLLFNHLLDSFYIDSICDFVNSKKLFPIDSRERFSIIYLNKANNDSFSLMMNLDDPSQIFNRNFAMCLNRNVLNIINPETRMIPNLKSSQELKILLEYHTNFNIFAEEYPKALFGRLVHFTSHADDITHEPGKDVIPIYEGKFIERYDGKFSTFKDLTDSQKYQPKARARLMNKEEVLIHNCFPEARYFISRNKWEQISKKYDAGYSLMWRSLTSATNRRITLSTILPTMPTSQSIQFLQYGDDIEGLTLILAIFNSVIFDYLVKLKLNGIDLTQTIIKQIPVPSRTSFKMRIEFKGKLCSIKEHVFERIVALYRNDIRLTSLCENISSSPSLEKDDDLIKLELDYLLSIVYKTSKQQLISIMKAFPKCYTQADLNYIEKLY